MENLPPMTGRQRIPLNIRLNPHFQDHHFEGRAVFPAVEALSLLARTVAERAPELDVRRQDEAIFPHFLPLPPAETTLPVFVDLETRDDGGMVARLITVQKGEKAVWSRNREHARLCFPKNLPSLTPPPLDRIAALEGPCFTMSAERLYEELVPFGPAYRNLKETLYLSEDGAIAVIDDGSDPSVDALSGSPFPLDAAFHAASAWGQRYRGAVVFPVGFEARWIPNPTRAGERYIARIFPVPGTAKGLRFDIWIFDETGRWREAVIGVEMRDPTGGRWRPPAWVRDPIPSKMEAILSECAALSLVELNGLAPFAALALSKRETDRFAGLGERRRPSFLAARIAGKRVIRKLAVDGRTTPARELDTIDAPPRDHYPRCPLSDGRISYACSVAHDRRFAVAVAGRGRIGIDIEPLSDRVLASRRLFMHPDEIDLADRSPLGAVAASLRVWTIKEALSKAIDLPLPEAWRAVAVIEIGEENSRYRLEARIQSACHGRVADHLLTWVALS